MRILLAFACAFTLDFLWTRYIKAVALNRMLSAATLSAGIGLATLTGFQAVLGDSVAAAAYVAGLWLGTIAAMWNQQK